MIDFKLLEALSAVVEEEGFEKAAGKLFITQSAVSQRIRTLEEKTGQILISRETPPKPTKRGYELIKHYRQILALEADFVREEEQVFPLGINADSLATWFLPAIRSLLEQSNINIEIKVDDQEKTAEMLKKGLVAGCISSNRNSLQGCRVHYLGEMEYSICATQGFIDKWFPEGLTEQALMKAPAVIFNRNDRLHDRYLNEVLGSPAQGYPRHYIPSSEKFVDLIEMGVAYGVVPDLQIINLKIINAKKLRVPLYWHHWNLNTKVITMLTDTLLKNGRHYLT